MSIKTVIVLCKAMGVRVIWNTEWQEFRVDDDGEWYHTDSKEDVLETAAAICRRRQALNQ